MRGLLINHANDWAIGAALLEIDIEAELISDFEVIEDGRSYREWRVPARVLNDHASVRLI